MCIAGGSSVSIFDRYRTAAAASPTGKIDVFGKPAPAPTAPIQKIIDTTAKQTASDTAATNKAVLGADAPTAQFADRIEGNPGAPAETPASRLYGTLARMLGITPPQSDVVNDPTKVAAGRIGHAYGAHDLRIAPGTLPAAELGTARRITPPRMY